MESELIRSPYGLIEIERWGDGDPVFAFFHGFGGSVKLYHRIIPFFRKAGFSGISVSFPYHGNSSDLPDNPPAFSLKIFSEWLLNWWEEEGLPIKHLVAHSMGSRVAMYLNANHPKKFNSLHLIAPGGFYPWEIRMFRFYETMVGQILLSIPFTGNQLMKFLIPGSKPLARNRLRKVMKYYGGNYSGMDLYKQEVMHKLCLIEHPVHLIGGQNDHLLPPDFYKEIRQHFVNPTIHIIADSGHLPMRQEPLLTFDAILSVVKEV
jgi:pimeloyl-ACP methyl ester carboxylesterase